MDENFTPSTLLINAKSLESAAEATNYPYGRQLRTSMFYFVEQNNKGWRPVRQSIDPRNGKLNKPHAGIYSSLPIYVAVDTSTGYYGFVWVPKDITRYNVADGSTINVAQEFVDKWWAEIPDDHKKRIKRFWEVTLKVSPVYYRGVEINYPE